MSDVVVYSTRFCPYCIRAKMLLESKEVTFIEIDLGQQPDKRSEMEHLSRRTSVPQIFIGEYHVGGCDDLFDLELKGELNSKLGL
jgi:glutaredoxin 3